MDIMREVQTLLEDGKKEEAFEKGMPYVKRISSKFGIKEMDKEDVENEGYLSFWKALNSFDKEKGVSLKTYVGRVIAINMMEKIRFENRKRREKDEVSFSSFEETFGNSEKRDLFLDVRYFFKKLLPNGLKEFYQKFLELGSFYDAGRALGFTASKTSNERMKILKILKENLSK